MMNEKTNCKRKKYVAMIFENGASQFPPCWEICDRFSQYCEDSQSADARSLCALPEWTEKLDDAQVSVFIQGILYGMYVELVNFVGRSDDS